MNNSINEKNGNEFQAIPLDNVDVNQESIQELIRQKKQLKRTKILFYCQIGFLVIFTIVFLVFLLPQMIDNLDALKGVIDIQHKKLLESIEVNMNNATWCELIIEMKNDYKDDKNDWFNPDKSRRATQAFNLLAEKEDIYCKGDV